MKKTRYYILFAAAFALAACTSDELPIEPQPEEPKSEEAAEQGEGMTVTLELESDLVNEEEEFLDDGSSTRATINTSDYRFLWDAGDKIAASDGTNSGVFTVTSGGGTANFTVADDNSVFANAANPDNETFYAIYPQMAVGEYGEWAAGGEATALVYAEQDYTENQVTNVFGPYMGTYESSKSDNHVHMGFRQIGSIIDIGLTGLGVTPKSVTIRSNARKPLAGKIHFKGAGDNAGTMWLSDDDATGCASSTQSNVMTVNNIASDATYVRFYVLPVVHSAGLTITVCDAEGNYYTKKTSTAIGSAATEGVTVIQNGPGNRKREITSGDIPVAKPYYKKINFGASSTASHMSSWMSTLPGNTYFTMISLGGAHDAATVGVSWISEGASKAQSLSITEQLNFGVRAFDLRPKATSGSVTKDNIPIYHGISNCNKTFKSALDDIVAFLADNPSEAVFVMVHDEGTGSNNSAWKTAVLGALNDKSSYIQPFTSNLKLYDCRGKMVVMTRDDVSSGSDLCAKVSGWADNTAPWTVNSNYPDGYGTRELRKGANSGAAIGVSVAFQDMYTDLNTREEKVVNYIQEFYTRYPGNATYKNNQNWLFINMCNIASSTLGWTTSIKENAEYVNFHVAEDDFFNDVTLGRLGFMFFDYVGDMTLSTYGDDVVRLVNRHNFHYVFANRSRVDHLGTRIDVTDLEDGEVADDSEVFVKPQR